jgi:hypothetical protein
VKPHSLPDSKESKILETNEHPKIMRSEGFSATFEGDYQREKN